MTLEEAINEKTKMEAQIIDLVHDFSVKTGLTVSEIQLSCTDTTRVGSVVREQVYSIMAVVQLPESASGPLWYQAPKEPG